LNGLQIRRDCLEKPVLDALAKALSPEEIEEGIAQALACSTGSQNDAAARRTAILEELKVISAGEKRLLDALFVGGVTAESIKARIEEAHARRAVLEGELSRLAEPMDLQGSTDKLLAGRRLVCVPFEDAGGARLPL
jgi:hypothetical protein